MEEADQLCERVAIIDQGRIVALDTPDALKRSVGADAAVRVSADGDLDELCRVLRAGIPGAQDATVVTRGQERQVLLAVQGTTGVLPAVVQTAERAGFVVTDLSVSETTLETVFINLTGKDLRE
jgi:ABC-2 type transport system ATP-binding protein